MDDRDPSGRFVRGLTLGALLGAIIAGSSIWRRSKTARRTDRGAGPSRPAPVSPVEPSPLTDAPVVADGGAAVAAASTEDELA